MTSPQRTPSETPRTDALTASWRTDAIARRQWHELRHHARALEIELSASIERERALTEDRELFLQFMRDTGEDMECLPTCDSEAHDAACPVANPAVAFRILRERELEQTARGDKYFLLHHEAEVRADLSVEREKAALAERDALKIMRLEFTEPVPHTDVMPVEKARELLTEILQEWPGGLDEIESSVKGWRLRCEAAEEREKELRGLLERWLAFETDPAWDDPTIPANGASLGARCGPLVCDTRAALDRALSESSAKDGT